MNVQSTRAVRAEERKIQLIQLAMEMFAEAGWAGTSMRELAQRAHVSQGLIYHYFRSKEDLLLAVADHYSLAPVLEKIVRKYAREPVSKGLKAICCELYGHLKERRDIYWIFFREMNNHPELSSRLDDTKCEFCEHLRRYLEAQELKPHDSEIIADCILSVLFLNSLENRPLEPMLGQFLEALLKGLER